MNNSRVKKKIIPEKLLREIVEFFKNSLWKKQNSNDNRNLVLLLRPIWSYQNFGKEL